MTPATSQGHRFASNTGDDRSSQLWISSILCLIYSVLVLNVRLHIKWKFYGVDDAAISLATVCRLVTRQDLYLHVLGSAVGGEHTAVHSIKKWTWSIDAGAHPSAFDHDRTGWSESIMAVIYY